MKCRSDPEIVLAAMRHDSMASFVATDSCRSDRDFVLEAVKLDGELLGLAAEACASDRGIVLEAVKQCWVALCVVPEALTSDREIVGAAVMQDAHALEFAADELLADDTFATAAKSDYGIIKVSMLSGRSCFIPVASAQMQNYELYQLLTWCCIQFTILLTGMEEICHGSQVVPPTAFMPDWPGHPQPGRVTEYTLVINQATP
mmetsp:Transcript_5963/g.10224  ORF Transcript_5963/g.10224 Transcript_5963/m.10224 type:complete len:203 (+) Transcript_5963:1-609(+)